MKYLIFDITNLLYRTFYANKNQADFAGLAHHIALTTVQKYYRQFKPRKMIMCFDRSSWRKEYTASEKCVSGRPYKGTRRQKMSPTDKLHYEEFLKHLADFENIIREHTSIIALAGPGLEADDLVAGAIQTIRIIDTEPSPEFIVVSADKDLIQLLRYPTVRLINPANGEERTLDEWNGDAELFMFEKCLRGDATDNVQSAYPRIRKTRILKAYNDSYERANLMMETWSDPDGKQFVVKHLFEENKILMDLQHQPNDIRHQIVVSFLEGWKNPGKFSYFHFMRFLGQYELSKLAEQADQFAQMLSL